ncbi:helicase/secretion neighborhood CpaE-like protein [Prauserella marina]|uniref:Helicase/secretion neighborhood CpaE-like protein n=1 Tax=Prauserella marina TaxID=530584 RepID=A0A1G6PXH0_9PSEU|nr:septum site-determining protein Ssd [Prauserella marina]PWV78384.1 secretion/DNA translocation related CpaE-like protein [Prauserella marina]SDC84799.1 helicase/secretion neighborhood CpaE-like protein [Prauserella marina]
MSVPTEHEPNARRHRNQPLSDEHRPLVVAADDAVLDEVLRLAAAVGCDIERAMDVGAAATRWNTAPLVVVDELAMAETEAVRLPRRHGVFLVCKGAPVADSWRRAFAAGAEGVVALPDDEETLVAALADVVEGPRGERGPVLAVVGGRGGAGASVLSAGVALASARSGAATLLVDCDPLGGGIDLLLGAELSEGLRWPDVRVQAGPVSMSALASALPGSRHGEGSMSVLSCDRSGEGPGDESVAAVVDAGRRGGRTVVCDVPRRPGRGAGDVFARADLVVIVVPAEVRACVAATTVLAGFADRLDKVRVLVKGPALDGLTEADVASAVGVRSLGWLHHDRTLRKELERGVFRPRSTSSLGKASLAVLAELRSSC